MRMSRSRSDRPDRRRQPVVLLIAVVLGLSMSGCSWTHGHQYFVHWGRLRADVIIRERTSWDLTLARELFHGNNDQFADKMGGFRCHANRNWTTADRCVFKLLNSRTGIPELTKGVWDRATSDVDADEPRLRDFRGAFRTVIRSEDDKAQVADCLTLTHSVATQQNWTTRGRSDANCRAGTHVWE